MVLIVCDFFLWVLCLCQCCVCVSVTCLFVFHLLCESVSGLTPQHADCLLNRVGFLAVRVCYLGVKGVYVCADGFEVRMCGRGYDLWIWVEVNFHLYLEGLGGGEFPPLP